MLSVKRLLCVLVGLFAFVCSSYSQSEDWEMIQWSDKVPDGFFTLEDVTVGSTNYLYVHTGDYDYSVNPKQNWRGHCYSQKIANTIWEQLEKDANGDILTGTECTYGRRLPRQYVWFEYQPLDIMSSYVCGTIAKKSIIPSNYNDNAEFIFDYKGKTAKVLNTRKFKIISSLEVLENGDILFKLHHTGNESYTIQNNGDGTFTFKDKYIPVDSRDYSDLTSSLIFYLPTEYGTAVLNIPNNTTNAPTKIKEYCVSNMETDPSIVGSFNYALRNAGPGDVIKFCFEGEDDLVFTSKHVSEILSHPLVSTIDGSTYKGKVEIDKLNSTGVGGQCFFLGDGGNVNNVTFSNTVIQAKDKNTSVYFGNIEHCIFKNTIFFNVDYDLHIKNVEHCTFDGEYGPNPQIYAEVELINDCSFSNAEIGAYLCTGNPIIRGCVFSDLEYGIELGMGKERTGVVEIDNCEIKGVEKAIYVYGTDKLYLHHSNVSNSTYCILEKVDDLHVEFCNISVDNVITTEGGIVEKSFISPIHLNATNNTVFVNNTISTETIQEDLSLFNNTIIVNPSSNIEDFSPNKAVGNIFVCNGITSLQGESNVVLNNSDEPGTFNILDAASLLDGSFDKANDVFIPNYSINENKVSYVQLKAEKVNGTSIRFDRLTDVVTDINGVTRETNTCAGAVELKLIDFSVRQFEYKEVNDVVCPESPFGSVVYYYGTRWERPYSFIIELTDRKGNKFQSEPVLTNEYSKSIIVDKLPAGNYTMFVYYIDDKGEKLGMADFYGELSVSSTFDDHVKDKTNITIKELERSVPLATMGSRNYTVTNKCTEPNGGIDCSVYKWTDDVFTVQIYSVDEDENETLVLDDVQPDRIDEYNDVKTAIFMIHKLAGGTYKFKVSDACGVVIDYNFTVRDEIQPDPVLTYEVTPYSCKKSDSKEDAKDGSITINVENYGYNSTLSKVVGEDSEILSYTTRESDGSVIFNLTELGTSDNFTLKLQNTCFTEDKEFEINMKEEAQKNGLFYLKSAEVKANAECIADNRRIESSIRGGSPAYMYVVTNKTTGEEVYNYSTFATSDVTKILPEGDYKLTVRDKNGCYDEISDGLEITSTRTITAKKQSVCGDYIHVDLDYSGSLQSAEVRMNGYNNTKKVTFENADQKYFFMKGDYDAVIASFDPNGCQGFALLEEEEEKPLNIGYGRLPEIEHISCLNSEGGSYTYYPRSQMSLRGYKLVLVATNKTSGKSYKSKEVDNAGTALTVNNLPAGNYNAYLALTYEDCIVESSKMALDDFTIETIADPSLDVESIKLYPPYCHATQNGDFSINIKNWNSECKAYLFYDNEQVWSADHIGYEVGSYGISGSLMKGLSATESEVNGLEVISDVTVAVSSMFGGTFTVGLQDQCGNRTTKEFELNSIEKPAFNVVSAYTDLSCSDSKDGSMSVALYGGRPEYARVYVNNVKQDVTEDSRTIRLSGLEPGSYTFKYESISRYCADNATFTVDVMVPDPMDITVVPEDVVCPADGASVNFTITGGTGDKNITLLDAEGEEVATATAEYSSDNKNAVAAVSGLMPGQVYSAKVEDANGCPAEAKDIEVNYKNQGDLTGIDAEVTSAGQTCINRENGALTINYSGNTDEKELIFTAVDAKGGRHNASVNDAEGMTTIDYLAKGEYTIYVDYNNGDCSVASPFAKKVATATIKDASTTSIKVEEIKCSGKVFSTVHFGNVESVLLYDAEDNVTAPSIIRGITSSTEEGSFERAYLTLINGCEQNATLDKIDETDNLVATFKQINKSDLKKTEQSACDETTINDGSLILSLSSTIENPAYAYSIILKDVKGKVAGQIDDITDFSQSFEFRELAPGTYNGYLAVKVGDCLLEDAAKLFSEEIKLNTESVAVNRLALGSKVEDVCKGTATLPFTVTGAIEGATVKVMKGEEEIESIAIEEDGDYSTSALEVGKYTLVYVATNANGCIEKDEKTTSYTKSQFVLPIKNTQLTAHNATCKEGGDITGEIHFASWSTLPYPFVVVVVDEGGKELKSQAFTVDVAANSEANRVVKIEDLPVGDYTLKTYFVADECQIEPSNATSLWQQLATTKLDGNSDYRTNNTFSIYSPDPIDFTYTAEDVTCAEDGASVTFKVENANGTPTVTLYDADKKAVSTGMTIVDLKPGVTYSAKVEDENGCTAEIEEVKVTYKEQPSLEGIKGEAKPYNSTCVNKGNGGMVVSYKGNTDKKDLILIVTDTKGGRQTVAISEEEGDVEFKDLAIGAYTIYVDYNNGECATSSPAAEELDKTTIEAASAAAIAVEELHCGDKVYSNVQFGADMESVLLYDKDENATSVPLSRGVTSALVEGSFERAYLTYLNGCEQNATLEKTDETDNLVATFKQVTLTDLKKTEQSACDETTINDGSLTITLESTLENPAYSYSIILTDDKGKEINQIDDITDFTQPFVFNALAPGTYKGHLAVKVGDCLLEDEATLFSEEINLNKETVAVERLAYGKPVEDVCKGTATLPFTVKGAIEGATVKVMKGEEEIESIAIAEDGDYSTSALEVGKYTLVYTATNANGCIEKDEKTTSYTKTTFNLPLRNAEFAAKNPTCTDKNNGALSGRFGFASMATLPYPFYVLAIDENEKEYKSVVYPQDMPTNTEVSRDFLIDNLPAGDYKVKALYVTENCDVEIPMTWTIASKTLAGSNDYRTNNTFTIYNPKAMTATFTAEDVTCAEDGASVTFKVENANGTPTVTLYNEEGKAVSTGMTIVGLKPSVTYSAKVEDENGCTAEIEEVKVTYKEQPSLEGIAATVTAYDQSSVCENNGRLGIVFEGNSAESDLRFYTVDANGDTHAVTSSAASGNLSIRKLAAGDYTVYVDYNNDECSSASPYATEVDKATIEGIGQIAIDASSLVSVDPTCVSPANGQIDIDILNWGSGSTITVYQGESPMWGTVEAANEEYTNGAPCWFYYADADKKAEHTAHLRIPYVSGGTYKVEVDNGCGYVTDYSIEIASLSKPELSLREDDSQLAIKCAGQETGVIAFNVGGGNATNLKAYINDEEVTPDKAGKCVKEGLTAGSYTLSYKSTVEGCKDVASLKEPVEITVPEKLTATYNADNVVCAEKGAKVTFKVEGGTGNPTVTLYNEEGKAVSTGMTIVGLKPDVVYSAKVEDANGCSTEVKDIKVNYVEMPNLEEVTAEIFACDESCHEGKNGRIVATFSGVTALNNVLFTIIGEDNVRRVGTINNAGTAAVFEELAPGEYTVYVDYDNGECSSSSPVAKALGTTKIVEMGQIAIDESSFVPTVATCTEPANGRVDIDILNWGRESGITVYRGDSPIWGTQVASLGEYSGSAPCQFYYEDKEKQEAHTAHLKIENINGGTYKVEVDNGCGYKTDYTITLDELAKPSITFNEDDSHLLLDCDYSKDGVLAFSVEGGNASTFGVFVSKQNESGEFTDEIEVAADENGNYVATDLLANNYMATFKSKEEGCKDEASLKEAVEITAPEAVSMHLSYGKVECEATGAKATVEAGGGTPGYTYSWTNSEGTLLSEKEEITGLSEGKDYQVVVKDSKKCLVSQKFNIDPLVKTPLTSIKVSNSDHKDQTCYNINNGSISFSFSGNSAASSLQFAVFGEDGQPVAGKSITSNAEKDDVTIDELAPGIYDVKLAYSYKGCEADDKSISVIEAINIEGLEKPMFIDKNYTITPNKCENASEGRMHFEMMGWKDGIYTWTLQRAGQSKDDLTENTHHGELLENGAIAFDLWGLPEGENIFTMWDGCENGFRYSKSDVVKDAHEDKPELEVVDKIAFSCLDRKDGSFTFVASPWDVANTAKFKKDEEEAKDVHPSLKDGKAYFEYKEQGAGTYTLSVKDLCKRDVILPFDFTEFSSKNGALVAAVDFDADAAKCDVDARQFTVTANGGTAPYVYAITKVDGTEVKTSEAIESTTFESDLLTDGSYKVSVTDKTDCKAIYNGDIIIDPAHVMEAKMREAVCGDKKTVLIVASIDKGTIAGNKFVAYDAEGKSYPAGMALGSMSFYSIPVDVKLKGLSAVVGAECSVYAETVELPLDASALETANVTVASHHNQQCYKVDNGEITLNYEGPEMSYDVMMFLKYTVDGEVKYIESEPQHGTKLQFAFEKLAPGEYELYLTHVVGKCDAGVEPRKIQDVTIKELKEPLELFKEKTRVIQSTCYSEMNAQAIIAVTGWVPDTYKETFYKYKEDGSLEYLWSGMNANDISDEEHKVHAWATEKNLTAGKYHTTWGDICTPEKVVYDFTVEPLNKPKLEILSSSYTDLKCSYDKAYIDFKYEGGAPDNKRLLFKFQPKGKGYDDWNWTTEELKSENTYRYYGHAMGDGNQGHDKAEGTTYELTDEDKGLADGSYVIIYQDSTGACPKDEVSGSIVVKRNEPINIFTYSRNVVCQDKAQGSLAFVFNRLKIENNDTTIATGPSYTNENFPNKYTGTNWANLMFLPEAQQSELYHRGYNAVFGSLNNKDLLKLLMSWGINNPYLLVYYTQYIRDNYPYSSNMFSDVNKIEIISRNKSHEQLYSELAKAVEDSTMKYPLREMYLHGKDYQVPTEWMGFKSLYPDFYNIVITDDLGCRYVSDTIEITVPSYKKPLTIDEVVFDAEAGYCDADKRRITFRASGGWGDYHYSAVNLDSADIDKSLEELPDDDETEYGKLLDKNYVADGHVEAFGQKGTSEYYEIYTTPIQKPGRIKISVVDSLGCTTTGGVYELTAKYLLSGLTQNDWCSPDENNNYYPVVLNGSDGKPSSTSVDSFKVRIGHRTVREDSVEYRKVLPNELLTYDKNADEEDAKYYGKRYIGKVPGGQVGFFAYMPDGCSAFNEEEFLTSDNFRKLTLTAEGNLAANCYLEPSGALQFSIYGGNDSYDKLYLDGRDLMTNAEIESIQKHSVTSKPIIENGEKVGVSVDTVHLSSFSFYEFATEDEFNTLNEKFNVEAGSTQDIKINYYFTLQNLVGNTNLIPPFEAKDTSHILIVQDAKGCRDTLDFKVDQPEKLQITAAGSVMCADGSGRIFVDQVSGGVGDYLYSLDDKESFDDNTHKPIVFGSKGHVLYVQDANNCVSEPSNTVSTGEAITWDDVEQDVMISTWHDYGDVLVVIDKTNYHALKYVSGENKGKPFEYHYDSIKVEIIRSEDFPVEVVGVVQPKEYYIYGIKGPSFDNVEGGETDVDTTGMHIDASGSVYKYVSWLQKNVYGPTWGVPEEVIASIKPDDQVQFLDKQYSIEKGALDDSVRNVVDKLCRNCGYLDKLRSMNRLSSQLYKSEADELKIEQLRNETDAIFAKYHQTAEASLNYDVKVEAMKQKYGFGYGTLSGIRSTFDKLVPDSAAERMTFIKFEENRTTGTNGTPAESVLEKYFSSNNDSETLSFGIRTTTYVSGCDITEEYNSLVLNLKGDNPYPNPDFKNTIRLECSPSVLTYPTEQQTELIVHMSKEEPFTYQVFGIDGKVLKTKTNNSSSPKTETNEDGETEYVFHIQLTGITQTCVVKVTTESNSAATKILVK